MPRAAVEPYLKYPWGAELRTVTPCWEARRGFGLQGLSAGAFGLFDISGNVWSGPTTGTRRIPGHPRRAYRQGVPRRQLEPSLRKVDAHPAP